MDKLVSKIVSLFSNFFDMSDQMKNNIITTLIVFFVLYFIQHIILFIAYKRNDDIKFRYQWKKISSYIKYTLLIIILAKIWLSGFKSIITFLGLLSAGLAIALKDLVANIVGWAFILWRRPFEAGDRIQIGDISGDVIDIRIFQFSLMEIGNWVNADQSTGRILHINNGKVFSEHVANYSKGLHYIWNEIPVLFTFESNWKEAKKKLLEIADSHDENLSSEVAKKVRNAAKKYMIFYSKFTPIIYTSVKDSGILLTIRYLCDPRKRRVSEQLIWEDILDFVNASNNIDFAYPTIRYFNNISEGKKPNNN